MPNLLVQENNLKSIADAIRNKNNKITSNTLLTFPNDFITNINNIETGVPLNFNFIYGNKPASATEGSIWINDSAVTKVNNYQFNNEELPSTREDASPLQENDICIKRNKIIAQDNTIVNLLQKNGIFMSLGTLYVYHNSIWKATDAEIFLNGQWKQFSSGATYLYKLNDWCTDLTGGWSGTERGSAEHSHQAYPTEPYINDKTQEMNWASGTNLCCSMSTKKKIDLSKAQTLYFKGSSVNWVNFSVWTSRSGYVQSGNVANGYLKQEKNYSLAIDVSKLTGSYYIGTWALGASNVAITECYFT